MTTMTTERADLDVSALTLMCQLSTDPALYAERLCCETDEEQAARRAAAADIIDDGLAAIARQGLAEAARLIHDRVEDHAAQVGDEVTAWLSQRGVAA